MSLFANTLALGIYRKEPRGMVTMIPIDDSLEPALGCTLQGVVWLKTPTPDQRAAIAAQIPAEVEAKECWASASKPCPNDTDGDGNCHLCFNRPGGCYNK